MSATRRALTEGGSVFDADHPPTGGHYSTPINTVTATARKIAVLFYNTLRYGMVYADPGASYYEARYRQRAVANLRRRAKSLGFTVEEYPTVAEGVS